MERITTLETFADEFVCFVKVTTDSGAIGWGQTSTYNADITAQVLHRQVAPWALGEDPYDVGGLIRTVEEREHKYPGSYRCRALAGVDTALWDLRGRHESKPVVELLGGSPGWLRAYASSMRRDISPAAEADRLVAMAHQAGIPVTPYSANLSLVTVCTMHVLGAIPNAGKYLELSIEGPEYYPGQQNLFIGDPFRVEGGRVRIPDAPGWGVEINPDWLSRAAYARSEAQAQAAQSLGRAESFGVVTRDTVLN